ncbi:unnamed protein product [Urochloa decumbens]|uniref:DUF1618 domain-containing protein n=1 Tax=Urochloa decumbens TaxID=240449 RepID=A0ABC8ZAA8_9POAL
MADSSVVDPFLLTPPPIHTEDPGSPPPPASILLDRYGYLSCRVNGTTAGGFTKDGKTILVTFWAATPPRVSCFTVHCPDVKPSASVGLPSALYSEDDLVLLRIPIRFQGDLLHADNYQYFVYQAGNVNSPPSLKQLPIPRYVKFSDHELVLLRRRDDGQDDMFYFAVLHRVIDLEYDGEKFDLYMYNSKTGTWSTEMLLIDSLNNTHYSYPSIVLAMGGEFGTVGWVDLWRGIIICDVLRDNHTLRYIPLPPPLVRKRLRGYPMFLRDIVVVGDYIKFFEMSYHVSNTGRIVAAEGLVAATKRMKISDIGSGNNCWEEDCTFKFSDIPVDNPKFAGMLRNLKPVKNTELTLKGLRAGYPALSLHDADVVCVMHTPDPDKDIALVVALDVRNKTLKDVADFGSGRPLGYTFTYLQSGISKHLNNWSSFRDLFVTADQTASQSSPDARAKLHKVEAAEEGLLLGADAEYNASQAHRPTPAPTTQHSNPTPATRAKLGFSPEIIFLRIKQVSNIIT